MVCWHSPCTASTLSSCSCCCASPDLYGVYIAILGADALSVDLLYQKLADGVSVSVAEIMLPAELRNFDFGAVAVTLGAIRIEVAPTAAS